MDDEIEYEKVKGIFLFADLIDSLECANYLSPDEYNQLLIIYQDHFWEIVSNCNSYAQFKDIKLAEINTSGDGVSLFIPENNDLRTLIYLAVDFKTSWLLSDFNMDRIEDGKPPIDISIGLNLGPAMVGPRSGWSKGDGWIKNFRIGMEGFPISLAKRFETHGREGLFSKIIVGQPVIDFSSQKHYPFQFHPHGLIKFKGLSQAVPVYELKTCWISPLYYYKFDNYDEILKKIIRIIGSDPRNPWYFLWIADLLSWLRRYDDAMDYIKSALKFDSDNAQAFYLLSEVTQASDNFDKAIDYLKRSIEYGGKGFSNLIESDIAYDGNLRFKNYKSLIKFIEYYI